MTGIFLIDQRGEVLVPELRFATIIVAADSTDAELVAAVSGRRIRVLSYFFTVGANATILLESGGSTPLTGTMDFGANGSASFSGSADAPAFQGNVGENLTLTNVGAGGNVEGHVCYVEVA